MADSFATVYNNPRTMEATMEHTINDEPLFGEDVPPIAWSHENISITVDVMGRLQIHLQQQQQQQRLMLLTQ